MSPEQARGEPCDGRSDLYSLGVVLFHLVCGQPPFVDEQPLQILMAHVTREPPDIVTSSLAPISDSFARIVQRAMAKLPEERYSSASDMFDALQGCLAESQPASLRTGRRPSGAQHFAPVPPLRRPSGSPPTNDAAPTSVLASDAETVTPAEMVQRKSRGPASGRLAVALVALALLGLGSLGLYLGAAVLAPDVAVVAPDSEPVSTDTAAAVTELDASEAEPGHVATDVTTSVSAVDALDKPGDSRSTVDWTDAADVLAPAAKASPVKPRPVAPATTQPASSKPRPVKRAARPARSPPARKGKHRRPVIDDALEMEVE